MVRTAGMDAAAHAKSSTTPRRRYPASLSHNPAGPSRPRPGPRAQSSVDDSVPPPASGVSPPPVLELSSLEHLLQQAGYKETRVFTPEAERARTRLHDFDEEDNRAAELADLYRSMGLDPGAPIHVRHMTKPSIPFRSSSSVLRDIVLQDGGATIDKRTQREGSSASSGSAGSSDSTWWGKTLLGRAAETVGKSIAAMSPPNDDSPKPPSIGLGWANGGTGVRKAVSNWELRCAQEGPVVVRDKKKGVKSVNPYGEWNGPAPPSLTGLFSPPPTAVSPRFGDDAFPESEDMYAYGLGDDNDMLSDDSVASSPDSPTHTRSPSPPLLDAADVLADLGLTGGSFSELGAPGRRVLANTIEYDEVDEIDTPPSPTSPCPIPTFAIIEATPEQTSREVKEAIKRVAIESPSKAPPKPAAILRTAQSTPALSRRHRPPPLRITPATAAPPAIQTASPVICDSLSNAAEDLPPLPIPPAPESPPPTSFGTLTLRARKSLSALRAYLAAEAVAEEAVPEASPDDLPSNSPILTPRIDWESQGFNYAGWNMAKPTQHKSRDSTDTMAEFGDPFLDVTSEIDYTKSFFYKPDTPTRGPSRLEPRKQRSIKSLKAALRLPVAPPVPVIPDKFKSPTTPTRTPPLPVARLPVATPSLFIHSPGAFEQGRPARPIILGADLEGRDIVNNWGKGVRKGKGKRVVKRSYDWD